MPSDTNETNIKLIWYYNNILGRPQKKKIISRWRGYHGSGLMTGSLTGLDASSVPVQETDAASRPAKPARASRRKKLDPKPE